MKKFRKTLIAASAVSAMSMAMAVNASASVLSDSWTNLGSAIVDLVSGVMTPLITCVIAFGAIYCVILGVKYALAEEPQERERAKGHLKNAIIGYALIFILIVALYLVTPGLKAWTNANAGGNTIFS